MTPQPPPRPAAALDVTGDVCPMTFVRTKLALEGLPPGAVLSVLLREGEPLLNVTRSCAAEGHRVLHRTETGGGVWTVLIERGPDE